MSTRVDPVPPAAARSLSLDLVTETFPPDGNGVAMTLGCLVDGMRRRGHLVEVIRPRQSRRELSSDCLVSGFPIPRYPGLRAGWPAFGQLIRRWRRRAPDVVHVATEGPLGWSAVHAARALSLPVTSGFHTNFHSYSRHYGFGWLYRPISAYLRGLHNRTQSTLVPTVRLAQELLQQGYRNVEVLSRGVDRKLFHPGRRAAGLRDAWGIPRGGLAVLHVGRLASEKNLGLVTAAFDAIRRARPDARMVWVGDGPQRRALEEAHPDHCFCGWRRGEDLAAHYASGDLFLFPSLTETYGNVTLEALASGVPTVAFACAAAAELVVQNDNGLTVPAGNEAAFVAAALGLASEPARLAAMHQRTAASVVRHDWDVVLDGFETILKGIASRDATR